jgi:dienelactone hydrolase
MTIWWRRLIVPVTLAAALWPAVACGGDQSSGAASPSGTRTTAVTSVVPSIVPPSTGSASEPPTEDGCPPARMRITLRTPDGVELSAVAVGRGSAGVVLLHESDGTLCNWWPYAWTLAGRGLHVVALDLRGHGDSAAQPGTGYPRYPEDVLTTLGWLRARGARQFALVGASMGGPIAMVTAERLPRGSISAIATLSAPTAYGDLDALPAAGRLPRRALYIAAEDDRRFPGYARTLAARTPAGPAALRIAPGADHGTGMLPDPTVAGGTVGELLATFLVTALR